MKKIILILLLFSIKVSSQVTLQTVYESPNSQINLYIVSQAYTSASMPNFDIFVTKFLNLLWTTTPFMENQQYFRVIVVKDIATMDGFPRSFNQFNPPFICQGGSITGSESIATFDARMDQLIVNNIPNYNTNSYLMAVFNNQYYTARGGRYCFTSDFCARTERTDIPLSESEKLLMLHVLIHEFAHTFGVLGDEYDTTTASVGPNDFPLFHNRNVTSITATNDIPWRYLIAGTTPIPTCTTAGGNCTYTVPGLYEGANYTTTNWYRPQNICKMRNVYDPFCNTCRNLLSETIIKHLCFSNQNVTENFVDKHLYITHWRKASNALTSNSLLGNRINLNYLSGNSITLQNGFHAASGSSFRGYVGDCSFIDFQNNYIVSPQEIYQNTSNQRISNLDDGNLKNCLIAVPNPTSSRLTIRLENSMIKKMVLSSIDGKIILSKEGINDTVYELNTTSYEKGIYLITIESDEGKIYTEKFIKE